MRKVKVFMLGAALVGLGTFGASYFGASEADAQSSTTYCEWNGNDCKSPQKTNYCGCEDPVVD